MHTTIDRLIINSPYEEPKKFWRYKPESKRFILEEGARRSAGYVMATPGSRSFDDPRRQEAIDALTGTDGLVLDDIDKARPTEYGCEQLFLAVWARNPDVAAWVRETGHEPCSHGWRWVEHWLLSRDEERQHIQWAIESIQETCGERPLGWYCRYGPSVNTRELLIEAGGFVYDSDAYNDDLPYFTSVAGKRHLIVPYNSFPYNDVRFVLAQGYSNPTDFFDCCQRMLN